MSYIGNQVTTVPFIADTFSGTGSQQSFNLVRAPAGTAAIAVFIGTAYQAPVNYSLSGTLLTFVTAPTAGTNNITVLHLGTGSATQVPSTGSVSLTSLSSDTYGYINAAFAQANTAGNEAVSIYANAAFATANSGASYANSGFAVANSSSIYANSGFAVANSGSIYANSAFLRANTPDATANSAAIYANGAFTQANTAASTGKAIAMSIVFG
jgi:hypothetical protein